MPVSQIILRPYRADDVPRHFEAVMESRLELQRWMPWCHPAYSIDDSRTWVESQLTAFPAGTEYDFVISRPDERFFGCCGLNSIDRKDHRANLGYWIRTSETRRGVATQAVHKLARWAFAQTDLNRLEIVAAVGNLASQRVVEKAGAVKEGVARSRIVLHGQVHDAIVYSIVRSDFSR